jgi:hypothetical protein
VSWGARFDDPIALANGREIADAARRGDPHNQSAKKEVDLPEWQAAIEALHRSN